MLFSPQMTNIQDIISLMPKDSNEVKKEEEEHLFYNHGCILLYWYQSPIHSAVHCVVAKREETKVSLQLGRAGIDTAFVIWREFLFPSAPPSCLLPVRPSTLCSD